MVFESGVREFQLSKRVPVDPRPILRPWRPRWRRYLGAA